MFSLLTFNVIVDNVGFMFGLCFLFVTMLFDLSSSYLILTILIVFFKETHFVYQLSF